MPNKSRETANLVATSGVSTIRDLNATRVNVSGVGTISNGSITNLTGTSSTITTFTSTNGSITNLTGTSSTITTLRSTTLNADTGNIVTGVTTNFTSTNGTITNLTGTAGTVTTLRSTTGNFTTGNIVTGVTTNFTSTNVVISGVTTVSAGTAALPSISPSGDPNTGIFFPSADHLNFSTGGTSRVQIDSDGDINIDSGTVFVDAANNRFGVGTTSPGNALEVNGTIASKAGNNASKIQLGNDSKWSISTNVIDSIYNDRILLFQSDSSLGTVDWENNAGTGKLMRLDYSGRLLIGTTSATGLNSNVAPVLAGNFMSFQGSVSTSSGVATTLFALENLNATYIVTAMITGTADANTYHAVYMVGTVAANSRVIAAIRAGGLITLSLSGGNVQGTQSSGATQTITWSVTRMANL